MLRELWMLPSHLDPQIHWEALGLHYSYRSVDGPLGLRINLLFQGEAVSFGVFYELPCQANPRISLGNLLGLY